MSAPTIVLLSLAIVQANGSLVSATEVSGPKRAGRLDPPRCGNRLDVAYARLDDGPCLRRGLANAKIKRLIAFLPLLFPS